MTDTVDIGGLGKLTTRVIPQIPPSTALRKIQVLDADQVLWSGDVPVTGIKTWSDTERCVTMDSVCLPSTDNTDTPRVPFYGSTQGMSSWIWIVMLVAVIIALFLLMKRR